MKKKFLLLLLFTNSFSLLAKTNCRANRDVIREEFFQVAYSHENIRIDCDYVSDVHDALNEVAKLYDYQGKLYWELVNRDKRASYDLGYIITIPQNFVIKRDGKDIHTLSGKDNVSIAVHEFGHAIFSQWLEQDFPRYEVLFKVARRSSRTKLNLLREKGLKSSSFKISLNYPKFTFVSSIYHEFFADLITYYYYGDKDIVRNLFTFKAAIEKEINSSNGRSFARRLHTPSIDDRHGVLHEVRKFVGENLPSGSDEENLENVNLIYEAIVEELDRTLKMEDLRSIKSLNIGLIEAIKARL